MPFIIGVGALALQFSGGLSERVVLTATRPRHSARPRPFHITGGLDAFERVPVLTCGAAATALCRLQRETPSVCVGGAGACMWLRHPVLGLRDPAETSVSDAAPTIFTWVQ
jgi:hypothetical protein